MPVALAVEFPILILRVADLLRIWSFAQEAGIQLRAALIALLVELILYTITRKNAAATASACKTTRKIAFFVEWNRIKSLGWNGLTINAVILNVYAWVAFVYGLVFGSFLNVVGYRVPRRESIVSPPSHCPSCNQRIAWFDLIPVVSWLSLRGACRHCKQLISVRYPVLELACGILFYLTIVLMQTWPERIAWLCMWLLLLAMTSTDFNAMRVPNVISIPGAMVMFALSVALGVQSFYSALLGAGICYLGLYGLATVTRGGVGMGDAKLYLSIGAMLGPLFGAESFLLASCSGAVIGILMRGLKIIGRRQPIPFVPHILIGVILTVFYGRALITWYVHTFLLRNMH